MRHGVHPFNSSFHRNQRSKGNFKNQLEDIEGIGKAIIDMLLKKFKSVKNIKAKTPDEMAEVIGKSKAVLLIDYYSSNSSTDA